LTKINTLQGIMRCDMGGLCLGIARLDSPGTLYHVIVRGIEGWEIFQDDVDRGECAHFSNRKSYPEV
jgi:hypothetical protein